MMYRAGWSHKDAHQARILAFWIKRQAFENMLLQAIESVHGNSGAFDAADRSNRVVVQWDPDHGPRGESVGGRRAIQIGLKGRAAWTNGQDFDHVQDITLFVQQQFELVKASRWSELQVPIERVYAPQNGELVERLRLTLYDEKWLQNLKTEQNDSDQQIIIRPQAT